jgi:DNA primase catalytic subunit
MEKDLISTAVERKEPQPVTTSAERWIPTMLPPSEFKQRLLLWYTRHYNVDELCKVLQCVVSPTLNVPASLPPEAKEMIFKEAKLWDPAPGTSTSPILWRREFALYSSDETGKTIVRRFMSIDTPAQLRQLLIETVPDRLEFGAVYAYSPKQANTVLVNTPQLAELKFDIDVTDYIRPCCGSESKAVCSVCWIQVRAAIRTIIHVMKRVYGAEEPFIVFSGLKGAHVIYSGFWLSSFTETAREQLTQIFTRDLRALNDDAVQQQLLSECFQIWREEYACMLKKLDLNKQEQWKQEMIQLYPAFKELLESGLNKTQSQPTSAFQVQQSLSSLAVPRHTARRQQEAMLRQSQLLANSRYLASVSKQSKAPLNIAPTVTDNNTRKAGLSDLIALLFRPRLDEAVLLQMGHLLKTFDCIHPVSQKRCAMMTVKAMLEFDPTHVSTLGDIMKWCDI